jgi:hypothetical protein
MNLDEQFRSVLRQEAEMQTPTRPDIEGMIIGGQARRRRRRNTVVGMAAAAVLVGGGVYGVTQIDLSDTGSEGVITNQPTQPPESTSPPPYVDLNASLPEPGTYRKVVGTDASSGAAISADLTFEDPRWYSGAQPVISSRWGASSAGLGVFEAQALASTSGCTDPSTGDSTLRAAATTPNALGRQLEQLPDSTVVQAVTPTTAFGYDAIHLRLRVDAQCPSDEVYLIAEADAGSLGITYSPPWKVIVDFLIVDVDGTPIVVALWHDVEAPSNLVDEATNVRDSIRFVLPHGSAG